MDFFSLIKGAVGAVGSVGNIPGAVKNAAKPLPVHRWDHVSVNGHQIAQVTDHSVMFDLATQTAMAYWTFVDLADVSNVRTIVATCKADGSKTISLGAGPFPVSGAVEEVNPREAVTELFTMSGLKLSVRLVFDLSGARQEFRFDGQVWP